MQSSAAFVLARIRNVTAKADCGLLLDMPISTKAAPQALPSSSLNWGLNQCPASSRNLLRSATPKQLLDKLPRSIRLPGGAWGATDFFLPSPDTACPEVPRQRADDKPRFGTARAPGVGVNRRPRDPVWKPLEFLAAYLPLKAVMTFSGNKTFSR
jgi:hypothetical protein